ncbi:MAG: hypothetical protein IPF46_09610 [Saprospiraceae bacterium]|nr:hypothetical protein [Candidatus Vicinibacter affinis]
MQRKIKSKGAKPHVNNLLIKVKMLQIGDQFKHTFRYTQSDVDTFAKVSGDMNPLHIDPAAGANSIFGKKHYSWFSWRECFYQDIWHFVDGRWAYLYETNDAVDKTNVC